MAISFPMVVEVTNQLSVFLPCLHPMQYKCVWNSAIIKENMPTEKRYTTHKEIF